jgi:hypothetical protein
MLGQKQSLTLNDHHLLAGQPDPSPQTRQARSSKTAPTSAMLIAVSSQSGTAASASMVAGSSESM